MFARASRSIIGFGLVTALLMLTVATLATAPLPAFFGTNLLSSLERRWLLLIPLASAALSFGWGTSLVIKDPERSVPALEWWVRLTCPAVVLPLMLALLKPGFGGDAETALMLAVSTLALERLTRISLAAWEEFPSKPRALSVVGAKVSAFFEQPTAVLGVLLALTAGQALLIGLWSVWSHQRFSTYGFDLGQYDSVFACTLHGRWLAMPPLGFDANWGDVVNNHADFGTFFLLPFYALYPDAKTLLVLQAVIVAGGAIPLFLFASRRLPRGAAFVVALVWLAWAPFHTAQLYDFHWQLIAASLVVCALAALEHGKLKTWWVFFGLAILCREDVSIGLTALGLYLFLSGEKPKVGLLSVALAGVFFAVLRFAVMRNQSFADIHYKEMLAPGEGNGFGAVLKTLISNPAYSVKSLLTWEKARYVAQIFAPLAFLPMRRPWLWLLMIPGLFLTLLTSGPLAPIQINFQYVGNWAAYMFPAAVIALAAYSAEPDGAIKRRAALVAMGCAAFIASMQWGAYSPRQSLRGGFFEVPLKPPTEADRLREEALLDLMKQVPAEVALCTSERVQPHTTSLHLQNITMRSGTERCEYLLWSDIPNDPGAEHGPRALSSGQFEVVERRAGLTLARRKH